MLDFRKVVLALSVAGLGLVGTASAQITCAGGEVAAATPTLRAEGLTEQLPAITVSGCTGTTTAATATVTVTTNAPITNLFLNQPNLNQSTDAIATFSYTVAGNPQANIANGVLVGVAGTSTTMQFTFTITAGAPPAAAAPPQTVAGGSITISNIRINASGVPAGSVLTETASSGSGLFINPAPAAPLQVAFTNASLSATTFKAYSNLAICNVTATQVNLVGTVQITENLITAFSTANQETALETAGGANAVASNPAGTGSGAVAGTIVGSSLAVTFGNLGSGINYYIPTTVTSGGLTLSLVSGPTSTAALAGGSIGSAFGGGNVTGPIASVYQLPVTNGSATVYYMVTADTAGQDATGAASAFPVAPATIAIAAAQLNLYETVPTTATAVPATGPATVSVYIAGNAATGYPQFTVPATPTVVKASGATGFPLGSSGSLSACSTTLLFPYVAHDATYETGIALANAGAGTSALTGNTFQAITSGTCNITLYGEASLTAPITALAPIALAAQTVTNGTVNAFTLGSALAGLTTPVPTFYGYGVATCNYNGAHAFVQISDFTGLANGFSETYLAPVLTDIFATAAQAVNQTN